MVQAIFRQSQLGLIVIVALFAGLMAGCGQSAPERITEANEAEPDAIEQEAPEPTEPAEPVSEPEPTRKDTGVRVAGLHLDAQSTGDVEVQRLRGAGMVQASFPMDDAAMRVTVLGPADLSDNFASDASLKNMLNEWRRELGPAALDAADATVGEITDEAPDTVTDEIQALDSDSVHGYYMVVESASPGPSAKRFALNGYFVVGGHVVMMGGLYSDPATRERILDVIAGAQWTGDGA